ncbi:PAS and ANTAR domain-containing protein [uncultured Arthrobacter sp.]|uniref:PAS and ANTAR domain-containing protein n=1 Tax=uncultured Arthrobacter sp. TaxID=114050 RepID=UPI0028D46350|nr:PAS and ANTAR domain-containing protein [uncultured Arthrobacter sp.]
MSLPKTVRAYSSALGPADCVAGTFYYDAISGRLEWSDELYTLHGYRRGDIVPSVELLYAHKHPDDRERCHDIFMAACEAGGFFCSYHRIIDARMREHRVLTAGEALMEDGSLSAVEGFIVDLTSTLHWETEKAAREAVAGALGTRSTIEQAKGILMGILRIGSEAAFDLMAKYSQDTNIKVASTAADLVQLANSPQPAALLDTFVQELRRPSESHADSAAEKDGVPSC